MLLHAPAEVSLAVSAGLLAPGIDVDLRAGAGSAGSGAAEDLGDLVKADGRGDQRPGIDCYAGVGPDDGGEAS